MIYHVASHDSTWTWPWHFQIRLESTECLYVSLSISDTPPLLRYVCYMFCTVTVYIFLQHNIFKLHIAMSFRLLPVTGHWSPLRVTVTGHQLLVTGHRSPVWLQITSWCLMGNQCSWLSTEHLDSCIYESRWKINHIWNYCMYIVATGPTASGTIPNPEKTCPCVAMASHVFMGSWQTTGMPLAVPTLI
jgi:hypothetical protein